MRLCVAFRRINAITVRPAASIPSEEDIFYAPGKIEVPSLFRYEARIFLRGGYGKDLVFMSFTKCLLEPRGAPATFENCMNAALGDVRHFALAFVDDFIAFSETFEEHIAHLQEVLNRLRKANIKLSKCEFIKRQLNYLGHVISDSGISVDTEM